MLSLDEVKDKFSDALRKNLFKVEIDGYPESKYCISSCKIKIDVDGYLLECEIMENENFEVMDMLNSLHNSDDPITLNIKFYSPEGSLVKTLNFKSYGVEYSGDFSWSSEKLHFWNVKFWIVPTDKKAK